VYRDYQEFFYFDPPVDEWTPGEPIRIAAVVLRMRLTISGMCEEGGLERFMGRVVYKDP